MANKSSNDNIAKQIDNSLRSQALVIAKAGPHREDSSILCTGEPVSLMAYRCGALVTDTDNDVGITSANISSMKQEAHSQTLPNNESP